jgi:hypothetical protein
VGIQVRWARTEEVLQYAHREHSILSPSPTELKAASDRVVWLGSFNPPASTTSEREDLSCAHILKVRGGKVSRVWQHLNAFPTPVKAGLQ